MGVRVYRPFEFQFGVLGETFPEQELPQLIVHARVLWIFAQRVDVVLDLRVQRIGRIEILLDEERFLIRIPAVFVIESGATEKGQSDRSEGHGSFHHFSWTGFAFNFTLPSTTSTRKATALTL